MPTYLIRGKRTKRWYNEETHQWVEPDKRFAALDYDGKRVTKLENAGTFAEKADAENWINSHKWRDGVELKIDKAK